MIHRPRFPVGSHRIVITPDDLAAARNRRTARAASSISPIGAARARTILAPLAAETRAAGVVAGVVGPNGELVGRAFARPGERLLVGRHERCDLALPDPGLSLRHLCIFVGRGGRAHLFELATLAGVKTESGAAVTALASAGERFVTAGAHVIGVLPTVPLPSPRSRRATEALGGVRVARVQLVCAGQVSTRDLDYPTLARGVLFGRYDRCQSPLSADDAVSRVHLLIAAIDDELWAIDTASTNGCHADGERFACRRLADHALLTLGARTLLRWQWLGATRA